MSKIIKVIGREIIDSRGNPTVEAEIHTKNGFIGLASVPSGASTGINEAMELRDKNHRFLGKGVMKSVNIINTVISQNLKNIDVIDQCNIDRILINLDGTINKSKLGANTILAVSLAAAKTASLCKNIPLYEYISELIGNPKKFSIPLPLMNILNGGLHANNNIDIQEFMIQPISAKNIKEAIQMCSEIFHNLSFILKNKGMSTTVGDEGGYSPNLESNFAALDLIKNAVENSKYQLGKDITLGIDCAASKIFNKLTKLYKLKKENKTFTSKEFTNYLKKLTTNYPITYIEDGLDESDWDGFKYQTKTLGNNIQIVGDDLFVTNPIILNKGIKDGIANSILIKLNQIGSLTETLETIKIAKNAGYYTIISHRSGETEDTFIADLAVGTNSGQIKAGSISRTDRVAKYNQLIRIEEKLNYTVPFGIKL